MGYRWCTLLIYKDQLSWKRMGLEMVESGPTRSNMVESGRIQNLGRDLTGSTVLDHVRSCMVIEKMIDWLILSRLVWLNLNMVEPGRTRSNLVELFFLSEFRPGSTCSTMFDLFDLFDLFNHVPPPVDPASCRSMLVVHFSEPREALIRGRPVTNQGKVRVFSKTNNYQAILLKKILLANVKKKKILLTTFQNFFFYFNNLALWPYWLNMVECFEQVEKVEHIEPVRTGQTSWPGRTVFLVGSSTRFDHVRPGSTKFRFDQTSSHFISIKQEHVIYIR